MDEPLDEQYLIWLYRQVASIQLQNPARTYWSLLKQLYVKEYIWLIPNDDNRVEDGRDLRYEFIEETHVDIHTPDWLTLGCSVLEMLIALSRRLAFEADGEASEWFWTLLENVNLRQYNDLEYGKQAHDNYDAIEDILDEIIWRTYSYEGLGGLFPLRTAYEDQRDVEIWYQLSAYLSERE